MMDAPKLLAWCERQPLLEVLDHVGSHGGQTTIDASRIACRRAAGRVRELEAQLAAYDAVAQRLFGTHQKS